MNAVINPSTANGCVEAPPSKSYAHRLMICAALAEGKSTVHGISDSQDMQATTDCIRALGAECDYDGSCMTIQGNISRYTDNTVFPCRESGSTLRFFMPIALALGEKNAVFTGTERLIQRGVGVYEKLFSEKGIVLEKEKDRIKISGELKPGNYMIPGDISSQFVSGLLFALPLLNGDSMLKIKSPVESRPYIDITIDSMRYFGVNVINEDINTFYIPGRQSYRFNNVAVEGDWSNSAALFAFNLCGGNVCVTGLNENSIQGDRACTRLLSKLNKIHPEIDISDCPDLGPVLFAAAAAKHGAVFTGTRRLRIKESDRAAAMAAELEKFGIMAELQENRVTVFPGSLRKPEVLLQSHNDHRIVMALSILASITGGEIAGAEAVCKSFPSFFETLSELGLEVSLNA